MARFGISPSRNANGPLVPEEDVVDRLGGLQAEEVRELLLADRADHDEDLAEQDLRLLLDLEGAEELLLGDEAEADEETAEELALDGGGGGDDPSVLEVDPLLAGRRPGRSACRSSGRWRATAAVPRTASSGGFRRWPFRRF